MTAFGFCLLLVAALTHAAWNLLGKKHAPSAAFFLLANTFGLLWLGPAVVAWGHALPLFPAEVWGLIVATGVCQAAYYVGLAGAYRAGALSVAYPVARSLPVVMVALAAVALGRGRHLSPMCLAGMAAVLAGILALTTPGAPAKAAAVPRRRIHPVLPLAFMAAVGTAGYSLIDDAALRQLRATPGIELQKWQIATLYAFLEVCCSSAILSAYVILHPGERRALAGSQRALAPAALAGFGIHFAYTLVLLSMAFAKDVTYVVVVRQLSIPLGAIAGIVFLREDRSPGKMLGVALVFAGAVLTATG